MKRKSSLPLCAALAVSGVSLLACGWALAQEPDPESVSPSELEGYEIPETPPAPEPPVVAPLRGPTTSGKPKPATGPTGMRSTLPAQPEVETGPLPEGAAPAVGAVPAVYGVVLGGLDKIAARTAKFEVDLGKPISYNTLIVTAHTCKTRPPEEPPESAAYLDIEERRPDGTQGKLFSGWMFASSPALNALEHPIYDVWVVSCKTSKPDTASPAGPNS